MCNAFHGFKQSIQSVLLHCKAAKPAILFGLASKFRKIREAKVRAFYSLSFSFPYYTYFLWVSSICKNREERVVHLILHTEVILYVKWIVTSVDTYILCNPILTVSTKSEISMVVAMDSTFSSIKIGVNTLILSLLPPPFFLFALFLFMLGVYFC